MLEIAKIIRQKSLHLASNLSPKLQMGLRLSASVPVASGKEGAQLGVLFSWESLRAGFPAAAVQPWRTQHQRLAQILVSVLWP